MNELSGENLQNFALNTQNFAGLTKVQNEKNELNCKYFPKKSGKKYKTNPFLTMLVKSSAPKKRKRLATSPNELEIVNTQTGETQGSVYGLQSYITEENLFCKVFINDLLELKGVFCATTIILFYIIKNLEFQKDWIIIDKNEIKQETDLSTRIIDNSINKLVNSGYLAQSTVSNKYYINPSKFFKGNRLTYLKKENEKQKSKVLGESR